jgi:ankyrin repeat protein
MNVVRFLLSSGADLNCKSAKHGTLLMTALEAYTASMLWRLNLENAKKLVNKLSLPDSGSRMVNYRYNYEDSAPISFRQLLDYKKIVRLLFIYRANVTDDSRSFGLLLHLACLLGSKALIELLLKKGADLNLTAGFFEKTIFAVI